MFWVVLIDSSLGIIISHSFQTLFSYNKATEPASSLSVPIVNNPAPAEDTLSVSGLFYRDNQLPVNPLAGS